MTEENRDQKITFRVTTDELKKIEEKIEKSKLTKSEYLRKSTLNKKIVVVEGIKECSDEVRRIGSNINQLTKAVHVGRVIDLSDKLEEIQKELNQTC